MKHKIGKSVVGKRKPMKKSPKYTGFAKIVNSFPQGYEAELKDYLQTYRKLDTQLLSVSKGNLENRIKEARTHMKKMREYYKHGTVQGLRYSQTLQYDSDKSTLDRRRRRLAVVKFVIKEKKVR